VSKPIKPPFPYYGSKQTLADRILPLLPPHRHYVEPYAGSLAMLLAKPRIPFETVNDLDGALNNFWTVLRDHTDELERVCGMTPHSRAEYVAVRDLAAHPADDPIERARRTWVLLTQGRSGSTGRPTEWRHYINPSNSSFSMPGYLKGYVARFGPAVARLHGVSLECLPALDLIGRYGRCEDALLYVDPPYVRSTRTGRGYTHEMSDDDHRELAAALREVKASVVLSGYASPLYDEDLYPDWHRTEFTAVTGNGGQRRARTEVLWSNRRLVEDAGLFSMFPSGAGSDNGMGVAA